MKFYIIIIPYKSKRPFKSGKQSNSRICSIVSHYTIVIIIIHYKSTHNQVRLFLPGGSYKASYLAYTPGTFFTKIRYNNEAEG